MKIKISRDSKMQFVFLIQVFCSIFIIGQTITVKRHKYSFEENFNILYSYIKKNQLYILGVKNANTLSKKITLVMRKFILTKSGIRLKDSYTRKFIDLKKIRTFLEKRGIKSRVTGNSVFGNYLENSEKGKVPVINYSKFEKKIKTNSSVYTITQMRIGDINNIGNIQTKIIIKKSDKVIFEKKYPMMVPFSLSKINGIFYAYLCSFKFALLKSAIEYIFNRGLSLRCNSLTIETLEEKKIFTAYFDPDEFGNIMRGIPIVYVLGVNNKQVDKIIVVLRKKKLLLNLCKKGSTPCEIMKKMSIDIEFPKTILTTSQHFRNYHKIILIYPARIEVITLSLSR